MLLLLTISSTTQLIPGIRGLFSAGLERLFRFHKITNQSARLKGVELRMLGEASSTEELMEGLTLREPSGI